MLLQLQYLETTSIPRNEGKKGIKKNKHFKFLVCRQSVDLFLDAIQIFRALLIILAKKVKCCSVFTLSSGRISS